MNMKPENADPVAAVRVPQEPPARHYDADRRCCTVCDGRKVCHVCGAQTLFACADCRINFGVSVFVCPLAACRAAHESKCVGSAAPLVAPAGVPRPQRYDLATNYRCGDAIEEMEPSDDGEWVRYDELESQSSAVGRLPALDALLRRYLDNHCANSDAEGMSTLCECKLCLETRETLAGLRADPDPLQVLEKTEDKVSRVETGATIPRTRSTAKSSTGDK